MQISVSHLLALPGRALPENQVLPTAPPALDELRMNCTASFMYAASAGIGLLCENNKGNRNDTAATERHLVLNFAHYGKVQRYLIKIAISFEQCLKIQEKAPGREEQGQQGIGTVLFWESMNQKLHSHYVYFKTLCVNTHFLKLNTKDNAALLHDNTTFSLLSVLSSGQLPYLLFKTSINLVFLLQGESCLCSYKPQRAATASFAGDRHK